jgi:DNA-binding MarR family transcriptional regulator
MEQRLAPLGLTPSEWGALNHCPHGVDTPAGLADCLGINPAAVTRLLDRLERAGLVERTPHPGDGRSALVRATERGCRAARQVAACGSEIDRVVTRGLNATARRRLVELLQRAVAGLPKRRRPPGRCP